MDAQTNSRPARGLALFLVGCVLALARPTANALSSPAGPGPVDVWACDRDGHKVYGLDRNLFHSLSVDVAWPIELEARHDGGVWVARSASGSPVGEHFLLQLSPDGVARSETGLSTFLDLATLDGRDALVVELGSGTGGANRALRVDEEGLATPFFEHPGLSCVTGTRDVALLGTASGELYLYGFAQRSILQQVTAGGGIGDVAVGPRPGTWWVLDLHAQGRLMLVRADLSPDWSTPVGLAALHLIPVRAEERVWLADSTEPVVRRFGPGGRLELQRDELRLSGLDRGVSWKGGALLVAPGALLHVDQDGGPAPGQGGFDFLVDVAAVPR